MKTVPTVRATRRSFALIVANLAIVYNEKGSVMNNHVKLFLILIAVAIATVLSSGSLYAEGGIHILFVEATSGEDTPVDSCVETAMTNVKKAFESEEGVSEEIARSRRFELRPSGWEKAPIGLPESSDKSVSTKSIKVNLARLNEIEAECKNASLEADPEDALFVLLIYSQNAGVVKKNVKKNVRNIRRTKDSKDSKDSGDAKDSKDSGDAKDGAAEKIDAGSIEFQNALLTALKVKEHRLIVLLCDSCGAAYESMPGAPTLNIQATDLDRSKMAPKEFGYLRSFLQSAKGVIATSSTSKGETSWGGEGTRFTDALIRLAANGLYLDNELEPDAFARLLSVELERECMRFSELKLVDLHRQTLTKLTPDGFVGVRPASAREKSDELEEEDEERYRALVESGEFKLEKTKAIRFGGNSFPRF